MRPQWEVVIVMLPPYISRQNITELHADPCRCEDGAGWLGADLRVTPSLLVQMTEHLLPHNDTHLGQITVCRNLYYFSLSRATPRRFVFKSLSTQIVRLSST
ncbi:hypothetical protein J6590_045916 [Homalodisca vitripennis]|nr:hypothetical protein J6590_045916 [Homalodisca vitripennis]